MSTQNGSGLAIVSQENISPQVFRSVAPQRRSIFTMTETELKRVEMLADIIVKSSINYKKNPNDLKVVMLKGVELGLEPFAALSSIDLIMGIPTLDPAGMLGLIYSHDLMEDFEIIEETAKRSTIRMHRKGMPNPYTRTFTIEDAAMMKTTEERDGKKVSIKLTEKYNWLQQPAIMLKWRNVAAMCRTIFGDVIQGLYTQEEMGADVQVDSSGRMVVIKNEQLPPPPALAGPDGGTTGESSPPKTSTTTSQAVSEAKQTNTATTTGEAEGQSASEKGDTSSSESNISQQSPQKQDIKLPDQYKVSQFFNQNGKEYERSSGGLKDFLMDLGYETKESRIALLGELGFGTFDLNKLDDIIVKVNDHVESLKIPPMPEDDGTEEIIIEDPLALDSPVANDPFAGDAEFVKSVQDAIAAKEAEEEDESAFSFVK